MSVLVETSLEGLTSVAAATRAADPLAVVEGFGCALWLVVGCEGDPGVGLDAGKHSGPGSFSSCLLSSGGTPLKQDRYKTNLAISLRTAGRDIPTHLL